MNDIDGMKLEQLKEGASVEGLSPIGSSKVIKVEWFGDQTVKVIYVVVKCFWPRFSVHSSTVAQLPWAQIHHCEYAA
ncbi:MAG: hypothetical protein N0C88_01505 [Candidatus Thiodiazotropha lotti]|uniref:Uncharacterized protein n=1 Tax=Candidatus Thiodiazotropha lotti TaxID=2792787 RepID=A0A9E4MZB6_9GAMM|nr:hypothetical protein [Candidatus Thiodiazotropha lotti]MCW4201987.1 hypothetical protein [Candidatus Thiodiazotropha lotti]